MTIEYVGGKSGSATNGGDVSLDLTALTGGIDTAARTGDLVLAWGNVSNGGGQINTAGYTPIDSDGFVPIERKFMGATPDTSVVGEGGGGSSNSSAYGVMVFRGVDQTTPLDATPTLATANSTNPNPPSITPATDGAAVVALAGSGVFDTSISAPTNYTNLVTAAGNDSLDSTIGGAWRANRSAGVAENPGPFGSWSSGPWRATTIALRPALGTEYDQSVLASTSPVATLVRQTGKPLSIASALAAAMVRETGKPLAAMTTPPAAILRATSKPLAAASAPAATLGVSRLFLQLLQAATAPVAALARQAGKVLAAESVPASSLVRSIGKGVSASTTQPATMTRATAKPLQASTSPAAALLALKAFLVMLQSATAPVAALVRQTGKAIATNAQGAAALSRGVAKALAAVTAPAAALFASKTFTVVLQAATAALAALSRAIGKPLAAASAPASVLVRQTGKIVTVPVTASAGLVRAIAKALAAKAFVAALLDLFFSAPAKVDPNYLLVTPARVRHASPRHARALATGEATRGTAADVHVRSLVVPAKDRDEP